MTRGEALAYMNGSTRATLSILAAKWIGDQLDGWESPWRAAVGIPLALALMAVFFGPLMRRPRA